MARTLIPDVVIGSRVGGTADFNNGSAAGDVANGNYFRWHPDRFLWLSNTSVTTDYTVTFHVDAVNLDGFAEPAKTLLVVKNTSVLAGPFTRAYRQSQDNDFVYVNIPNAAVTVRSNLLVG
jgi:hypothetical protein